jgi:hypothetical protein
VITRHWTSRAFASFAVPPYIFSTAPVHAVLAHPHPSPTLDSKNSRPEFSIPRMSIPTPSARETFLASSALTPLAPTHFHTTTSNCPICTESDNPDSDPRIISTPCHHVFHRACLIRIPLQSAPTTTNSHTLKGHLARVPRPPQRHMPLVSPRALSHPSRRRQGTPDSRHFRASVTANRSRAASVGADRARAASGVEDVGFDD